MGTNYYARSLGYTVSDFLDGAEEKPLKHWVNAKINLLYDLCVLCYQKLSPKIPDKREEHLRALLSRCKSEHEMTTLLRGVVRYEESVTDLLNRHAIDMTK